MFRKSFVRLALAGLAALTVLAMVAVDADARGGRGGSFGSRGMRTFAPPPVTQTAPNKAAPINRSVTQPQRPGAATTGQQTAQGGFFNRPGFAGGLMAGFLGAGLLGLLFGNGLLGGLGAGFASFLGLLLQVALIVIVARLILNWWQRRNGYATAGGPSLRDVPQDNAPRSHAYTGAVMGGGDPLTISEADFNMFEQRLGEVQSAYAAEDIGKLRSLVTPEMLSYFSEELADNASRGLVNEMSDVTLLQGDLAEAWREGATDYATVAMRYELVDATVERESGRVVEGSREKQEVRELWTFMRSRGGAWILSAIQQT